jgi:hypothetical protein
VSRPTYDRSSLSSLPSGAERRLLLDACDDRGCLVMHHPVDGVLVTRAAGHMSMSMATRWIESTEALWRHLGARAGIPTRMMSPHRGGAAQLRDFARVT